MKEKERGLNAGCCLKYSTLEFYNNSWNDIGSNRVTGSYGASLFQKQIMLVVLTQRNTGSLATAGYGYALGVFRALHSEGVLKGTHCTETRPFNNGSLTAFELVHDKAPSTLIADFAMAALMKVGCMIVVIVWANLISSNGGTTNKIGTYSVALCAKFHNVFFYVAAYDTHLNSEEHWQKHYKKNWY